MIFEIINKKNIVVHFVSAMNSVSVVTSLCKCLDFL